ncbi:MAG: COX15/CtaA family protein [Candidatus Omnitrophica bacterium]|nr:COX15/CtaA family protein [Candidatus Omnitrophota bacterium]
MVRQAHHESVNHKLHRYCWFLTVSTFALLVAGGLVTSTGSGLSVPDWPLSYGRFFPPMIGGIRFEHTHRVLAGFVGVLTFILVILLSCFEKRRWVRLFGLLALASVAAQAVLGGMTVIHLLPMALSVMHACLGQTFFALVVLLTLFTSREWQESCPTAVSNDVRQSVQRLFAAASFFVYAQLVLGALIRHGEGRGVPYHLVAAFLIIFHLLLVTLKISKDPAVQSKLLKPVIFLGFLAIVQIFAGLGAFLFTQILPKTDMPGKWKVFFATFHQTNGALILALVFLLTLRSFRLFQEKGAALHQSHPHSSALAFKQQLYESRI